MTTLTRLNRIEKSLQKQQDAALLAYLEWERVNISDSEQAAYFRFFYADPDTSENMRADFAEGLRALEEPLELQPDDEKTLFALWERAPENIKADLRRVGLRRVGAVKD